MIRKSLLSLIENVVPNQRFTAVGMAYWSTAGSFMGTVLGRLLMPAIMGGFTHNEHRAGILAITETDLFVIDYCTILREHLTLEELQKATDKPFVKLAKLSDLTATHDNTGYSSTLFIKGALKLNATFPKIRKSDNQSVAKQIAGAIQSAHT